MCDSRTVQLTDLVPSDLVRRRFVGETFYSRFNPAHRWYYRSDQQPHEVTLLKIFDSNTETQTRCEYSYIHMPCTTLNYLLVCLHSAFQYTGVGADEVRESFEVRALVFDSAN